MAQPSRVVTELSEADRASLDRRIAEGRHTLDDLLAWLDEAGYTVSRSSLGRYAKGYKAAADRLRQSREMTKALVNDLGEAAVEGQQGRMLIEMMRGILFDILNKIAAGETIDARDFAALAKASRDLSQALRLNQDAEAEVAERAARQAREDAAAGADAVARSAGISDEVRRRIEREILGLDR